MIDFKVIPTRKSSHFCHLTYLDHIRSGTSLRGFTLSARGHVSGHHRHTDRQFKLVIVIFKLKYCYDLL